MSERFFAWRFDGRTAEAHPASVWLDGAELVLHSGGSERRVPIAAARISEPFEHAPRMVSTADGESFEIRDGSDFTRALEATGFRVSPVVRLQRFAPAAAVALGLLVAAFASAYVYGIPAAARWAARATPYAAQQRLGIQVLEVLDRTFLDPSAVPHEMRTSLEARFRGAAEIAVPGPPVRVLFRSVRGEPVDAAFLEPQEPATPPQVPTHNTVNALSLPGGTIVISDGLVASAGADAIFAVLGHELGHIALGHSMQSFYRNAGVAALAGLAWGDFSGIAASVPATLGMLRYSRQLEDEADDFAVRFLTLEGLDAYALCSFFDTILQLERSKPGGFPQFLSTHPDTEERIARLCPDRLDP